MTNLFFWVWCLFQFLFTFEPLTQKIIVPGTSFLDMRAKFLHQFSEITRALPPPGHGWLIQVEFN